MELIIFRNTTEMSQKCKNPDIF